jgi:hypothetical protein
MLLQTPSFGERELGVRHDGRGEDDEHGREREREEGRGRDDLSAAAMMMIKRSSRQYDLF